MTENVQPVEPASEGTTEPSNDSLLDGVTPVEGETPPVEGETPPVEGETPPVEGETPPVEGVPEEYSDFSLPEGYKMDDQVLGKATGLFKEFGLNQENAQKFIDLHAEILRVASDEQVKQFNDLSAQWKTESTSDKEFGGEAFEENVGIAVTALNQFGNDQLKEVLKDHALGNHPEVIRFLWNVGKTLQEDDPGSVNGDNNSQQSKSREEILYPNQ